MITVHMKGTIMAAMTHTLVSIDQVEVAAKYISDKLIETDPDNAMAYQENLDSFLIALKEKQQSIREQLAPVKDKGYYVFHDAYGYYEEEFGLNNLGHFTVSPERKPGAKSLIAIKKTIVRKCSMYFWASIYTGCNWISDSWK